MQGRREKCEDWQESGRLVMREEEGGRYRRDVSFTSTLKAERKMITSSGSCSSSSSSSSRYRRRRHHPIIPYLWCFLDTLTEALGMWQAARVGQNLKGT
ncbi:hypothetical protein E2C01_079750 [Portunus trituberculatus]|uniref:Uncharacterized protein n=1 Tax=Portunus trituberculatus TaxID=210409 RepID=A0A5B7IMA2_PORTR|nr:hypothetical protein [Portunus trituberculatus]